MAKVLAFFPISRTMHNLTFYTMHGQNYVRKKSSLSAKRVKTSKQFERTRYYAGIMAQASKIGSALFRALPERWRQSWMYRSFTGEAMQLLKQGKTNAEVKAILYDLYVKEVAMKTVNNAVTEKPAKVRRVYVKRNTNYWLHKTAKATKRKQQYQKLQQNAAFMAKASVIASGIYRSLPPRQRKLPLYRVITGFAMILLKEGFDEMKARQECMGAVIPLQALIASQALHLPLPFQQAC